MRKIERDCNYEKKQMFLHNKPYICENIITYLMLYYFLHTNLFLFEELFMRAFYICYLKKMNLKRNIFSINVSNNYLNFPLKEEEKIISLK